MWAGTGGSFTTLDYTGIDINLGYVARATRMYGRRFHVMDASRLGFRDAAFDGAICIATLHHLPDDLVRSMIREALRVVKPAGALHIIDPVLAAGRARPAQALRVRERSRALSANASANVTTGWRKRAASPTRISTMACSTTWPTFGFTADRMLSSIQRYGQI